MHRDEEFVKAMHKMQPVLERKFYFLAQRANVQDDRKCFVDDMISWTIIESLINSRKEIHKDVSCEQLIKTKAKNVWAEYWQQRVKTFNHANHQALELDWRERLPAIEDTITTMDINAMLNDIDKKSEKILRMRMDGYQVKEIAELHNQSPASITMQLQRLKQKFKDRP